jgi:peroxiredoxin
MPRIDASTLDALKERDFPELPRPDLGEGTNDFIVVRHELGFAEYTLESLPDDGNLVLQAPGSIKGRVGDASAMQPAYTVQVARLTDGNTQVTPCAPGGEPAPMASPDYLTLDEQGTFEAHNLYPGTYELVLMFPLGGGASMSSHRERVEVLPGDTTEISLLDGTRLAKGHVTCSTLPGFDWSPVQRAFGIGGLGVQARMWMVASSSRSTPLGTRLGEEIPIRLQPDGNFLTANLVPGTYELSIIVGDSDPHIIDELKTRSRDTLGSMPFDPLAPRRRFPAPNGSMIFEKPSAVAKSQLERDDWMMGAVPIGYLRSTVDVPAGPADKQVDLGTFELFSHPRLKLNGAAPAFDIPTLDGGRIRLSDYRGKWLTLYFWHCGSPGSTCEMELRYLKMLWSEFQDNPRLALAGVVLDENSEDARASVDGGPPCPQGFDGGWKTSQIAKQFGIAAVPSMVLINPEGMIAGYNLWAQPLADVLDKIVASQDQK